MPEKSGRNKEYSQKGGEDSLAPADIRLWESYTQDIVPLGNGEKGNPPLGRPKTAEENAIAETRAGTQGYRPFITKAARMAQAPELDFRTEQKLRRGRMEIEGTLDLHGMSQARAHGALNDFVTQAHRRCARCLLVITGKGKGGEGVLRQKLSDWLSQPPLADMILKITQAQPRHGGGGAFYIYLRRKRNA